LSQPDDSPGSCGGDARARACQSSWRMTASIEDANEIEEIRPLGSQRGAWNMAHRSLLCSTMATTTRERSGAIAVRCLHHSSLRAAAPRPPSHGGWRRGFVCTRGLCPRRGPAAGSRFPSATLVFRSLQSARYAGFCRFHGPVVFTDTVAGRRGGWTISTPVTPASPTALYTPRLS